jgi:hypothetical protein
MARGARNAIQALMKKGAGICTLVHAELLALHQLAKIRSHENKNSSKHGGLETSLRNAKERCLHGRKTSTAISKG